VQTQTTALNPEQDLFGTVNVTAVRDRLLSRFGSDDCNLPGGITGRPWLWLAAVAWFCVAAPGWAATGRVVKVVTEFFDLKGGNSLSPGLYERDAYQVTLRDHPERRSGMRFYVEWKTKGPVWEPLTVRVELRGIAAGNLPKQLVLDQRAENKGGWFSRWTTVTLSSSDYKKLGSVTAWRVTLWEGQRLLGQPQSFLW